MSKRKTVWERTYDECKERAVREVGGQQAFRSTLSQTARRAFVASHILSLVFAMDETTPAERVRERVTELYRVMLDDEEVMT